MQRIVFLKNLKVGKIIFPMLITLLCMGQSFAQSSEVRATIQWQNKRTKATAVHAFVKNLEGDLVFVGTANSRSKDISFMVADTTGRILKDTIIIGGDRDDEANAVCNTRDGGYLIAGYTRSPKLNYIGKADGWVVKTDFNGKPLWEALVGTPDEDVLTSVAEDDKGDFLATGYSNNALWVVKISSKGKKLWEKRIPGEARQGRSITFSRRTNLCVVAGFETISEHEENLFLTGFDRAGNIIFDKKYADSAAEKLLEMPNGNWLVAGRQFTEKTYQDMLFLQTDSVGTVLQRHTYGGSWDDGAEALAFDPISETVCLAGYTYSHVRNAHKSQLWLMKTDLHGTELWQKRAYFGGKDNDGARDLLLSAEGQLFAIGYTGIEKKPWLIGFGKVIDYKDVNNINGLLIESGVVSATDTIKTFFEQNEHGFYEFVLKNNSALPILPIVAQVSETTKTAQNLWVLRHIDIGSLRAGESRRVQIPLSIGDSATTDTSSFSVKFFVKDVEVSSPVSFNVVTQAPQRARLEIVESAFLTDTALTRSKNKGLTLRLLIKNTGNMKAEETKVHFICPPNIKTTSLQTVELGNLEKDSQQTAAFNFYPEATYDDSIIPIRVEIVEKTRKHDTHQDLFVRIKKANLVFSSTHPIDFSFETAVEPSPNQSFLSLDLEKPNPIENGSYEFQEGNSEINLKIRVKSDRELADSNIQVYVNGYSLNGAKAKIARLKCIQGSNNSSDCVFEKNILLEKGLNKIEVKAKHGTIEKVQKFTVDCQAEQPNLYVLSIGVPRPGLDFSTKDAQDFAQLWQSQEKRFFGKVTIKVLNTTESTLHNAITDMLDTLNRAFNMRNVLMKDYLIVYISSHGFLDTRIGNRFCIEPADFSQTLSSKWLKFEEDILASLISLNCQQLFFIDACHSGKAAELSKQLTAMLQNKDDNFRYVLSSDANEFSYEDKIWQNGAFTKAIMEALTNQKVETFEGACTADVNNDNSLTMEELMIFLKKRVPFMVKKQKNMSQTPTLYPKNIEKTKNEFQIYKY